MIFLRDGNIMSWRLKILFLLDTRWTCRILGDEKKLIVHYEGPITTETERFTATLNSVTL